jgi:peptidoglycan/LPS O-acetylase OafA/YrhL
MSSGQDSHDERLVELDVLRGLAALAVMLYQYTVRFTQLYPDFPPAAAKLGIGTNAGIVLAIGLAIALAAAITFTIERPARNWIRARYRAMRSAQAARTAGPTASAAR